MTTYADGYSDDYDDGQCAECGEDLEDCVCEPEEGDEDDDDEEEYEEDIDLAGDHQRDLGFH